jgi:hypothetical protein
MAAENIGTLVQTKIPGYADAADIQAALRVYHYGSYTFDINEDDPAELVNPSIAYTINDLQEQIDNVDLSSAIQKSDLNAKGDILSASANDTLAVLSVGTDGQVLTASTAAASGLTWSTPEVTLTNTATLTNKTLTAPVINTAFNPQTVTTYTFVLSDNGKVVEFSNSSPIIAYIPSSNIAALPVGSQITVLQTGTGQVTIAPLNSNLGYNFVTTTVNGTPGLKLRAQWSSAVLIKRSSEQWVVIGDLVA